VQGSRVSAGARREQPLGRNVKRFRGGLVFKAHRLVYHSTLGMRVIKQRREDQSVAGAGGARALDWISDGAERTGVPRS